MINALAWLAGTKAGRIAAAVVLFLAGLAFAVVRAFLAGKTAEKAKAQAATLKTLQSRMKTDDEIARLAPDQRRERLRRWVAK